MENIATLKSLLIEIDMLLVQKKPAIYNKLAGPAEQNDLERIRIELSNGRELSEDLALWFQWHNGQIGYETISPEDNFELLSVENALDSWRFLTNEKEEIMRPYESSWFPLFYNGAGDYRVYQTEGVNQGCIITYWHDDAGRPVPYKNLLEWAVEIRSQLADFE